MKPGDFHGFLPGIGEITDPADWPAKWDGAPGAHNHRIHPGKRGARNGPYQQEYAFPARVTLTAVEKEWLGASVSFFGETWQVWSIVDPSFVWLVADGRQKLARVSDIAKVTDPVDTDSLVQ